MEGGPRINTNKERPWAFGVTSQWFVQSVGKCLILECNDFIQILTVILILMLKVSSNLNWIDIIIKKF